MNSTDTIFLKDALKIFSLKDDKGMYKPFDLVYRTFNRTSKKGGKLKNYQGVKYLPSANPEKKSIHRLNTFTKNPNHFKNRTRNIELPDGSIVTVRIDFIISINNQKVIY